MLNRASGLSCLWLLFAVSSFAQDRPNILVIWGDDVGLTNISAYTRGLVGYETPNIDRIAEELRTPQGAP
jgi:arylsulfatase